MRFHDRIVMLLLPMSLICPAGAQTAAPAPTPNPQAAQQEAMLAAEELALNRVIAGLRLTPDQIRRLLPVLEGAQSTLKEQEESGRQALLKLQPGLEETRRALIAGKEPSTRAEGLVAEQIQTNERKRRQLRADTVRSLRRSLATLLSADQQARLGETARLLESQRRSARWAARAAEGGRGGGPIGMMGRALDQVRGLSEANYPEERVRIAMRLSNLERGGRDREEPVLSPDDPQVQSRLAPYFALMDRVRQMPDTAFQQSRADLAMHLWAQRGDGGRGAPVDLNAEIDTLVDRYFLSPQMIPVMQKRRRLS